MITMQQRELLLKFRYKSLYLSAYLGSSAPLGSTTPPSQSRQGSRNDVSMMFPVQESPVQSRPASMTLSRKEHYTYENGKIVRTRTFEKVDSPKQSQSQEESPKQSQQQSQSIKQSRKQSQSTTVAQSPRQSQTASQSQASPPRRPSSLWRSPI